MIRDGKRQLLMKLWKWWVKFISVEMSSILSHEICIRKTKRLRKKYISSKLTLSYEVLKMVVVYFDQNLVGAQTKPWSKYALLMLFKWKAEMGRKSKITEAKFSKNI